MGLQASAALLLKSLVNEDASWLHRKANELMSRFSLFAIILADPVKDPLFYDYVQRKFSRFDQLTGSDFLFFSIVKDANLNVNQRTASYHPFQDASAYKSNDAAEKVVHSQLAMHAICNVLGVDYDNTPCLLVSNNLQFGQFCKFNTNIYKLEDQLRFLTSVAEYLKNNPLQKSLAGLLHTFEQGSNILNELETLQINEVMVGVVSDILQYVSVDNVKSNRKVADLKLRILEKLTNNSLERINQKIDEVISLLNVYTEQSDSFEDTLPNRAAGLFENKLDNPSDLSLRNSRQLNLPEFLLSEWGGIQFATKNHLYSASIIRESHKRFFTYTNDFTPYTSPLCLAFETETNLSLVQLFRKEKGIPMPAFFDKHYPRADDIPVLPSEKIIRNPRPICLNKRSDVGHKCFAPGLIESLLLFSTFRLNNPSFCSAWLTPHELETFIKLWKQIGKVRNLSAHPDPVPEVKKTILENSLYKLQQNGILNSMTSLKYQLSPKH